RIRTGSSGLGIQYNLKGIRSRNGVHPVVACPDRTSIEFHIAVEADLRSLVGTQSPVFTIGLQGILFPAAKDQPPSYRRATVTYRNRHTPGGQGFLRKRAQGA